VISAQEDERRRVARELHDETSQLLAALGMALHAGPGTASADPGDLLNRLQDGVHRLIVNLRPAVLDDLGLAAAINMLAETQLRRGGIAVRTELSDLEHHRLPPSIETAVFRIVQEAILNIVRHSGATSVLIQAGTDDGHVWVEIEDDGDGFDLAAVHPDADSLRGVGLLGMRERAELLGGRLTIESAPGEGTRVKVEI
jgi:signal transduction histidine kinase